MIGGCGVKPLLRQTFFLCLIMTRITSLFQNCHLHHTEKLLYHGNCINGTSQGLTLSLFLRISGPAPIIELNNQEPIVPLIYISLLNGLETHENWRRWVSFDQKDQTNPVRSLFVSNIIKMSRRTECESCFKWEHRDCLGISKEEYKVLGDLLNNIMFFCSICWPKVRLALKFLMKLKRIRNRSVRG